MDARAKTPRKTAPQDQAPAPSKADAVSVFDLGASGGSNIAKDKDSMIAEAFDSEARKA
jgi:hypothetical protein